jgi:hypothetical protein
MTLTPSIPGTRRLLAAGTLLLTLAATGCGGGQGTASSKGATTAKGPNPNGPEVSPAGDIPDNQAYVRYSPPGARYVGKVPEGWSRSTSGPQTTFTDKLNSITMQTSATAAPLTLAEARRVEVPKLAHSITGFHPGTVTTVHRTAGSALRITYTATGQPNPVTGKAVTDAVERYIYVHRGQNLILTLSGPKGADNVDPWRIVTDSVKWSA